MRVDQVITLVAFLSAGVSANPGGRDDRRCKKYEWDLKTCKDCKYKSPRDLPELDARGNDDYGYGYGYGRTCKKTCPEKHKQCEKWSYDYSKPSISAYFDEYVKCPQGDSYKVTGKIDNCDKYDSKQCLIVEYKDWDKYKNKKAYLGVYLEEHYGATSKYKLNYNKYCYGNTCKVPVKHLPGFPKKLCDVGKLYVGIDDDQCKEKKHYGEHGRYDDNRGGKGHDEDDYDGNRGHGHDDDYEDNHGGKGGNSPDRNHGNYKEDKVKYIRVHVKCKGEKKCDRYCCCA